MIPNTSSSLQTTLPAEAHLAEGQIFLYMSKDIEHIIVSDAEITPRRLA
jgi:hypothetical protein